MLKPVTVGRYDPPGEDSLVVPKDGSPYVGYVSTEDWILYQQEDGTLWLYTDRDESGAVLDNAIVVRPRVL